MSLYCLVSFLLENGKAYKSLLSVRSRENRLICFWIKGTESTWIITSVDSIDQAQVCEIVYVNSVFKNDHNSDNELN